MLSCTIDAKENRYIVVSDIPGAFFYNVHMLLEGTLAEIITKLNPTIYKNIYDTTNRASSCYIKKTYMLHYRQHFSFGNYYQKNLRSGVCMKGVYPTIISKVNNLQLYGMLIA